MIALSWPRGKKTTKNLEFTTASGTARRGPKIGAAWLCPYVPGQAAARLRRQDGAVAKVSVLLVPLLEEV